MTRPSAGLRLALALSRAVYRFLLLRYPRPMRTRYGSDMRAMFAEEAERRAAERGLSGLVGVWTKTAVDLARPLPRPIEAGAAHGGTGRGPARDRHDREGMMGGGRWWAGLAEDLGFAVRSLVREPRFSVLVVTVLSVGIALNTSAFAVLNAYLLRPLPFPEADRLVSVRGGQGASWSEVDHLFERAVSYDLDAFTIVGDGRPELAPGAWVTPDFLDTYGIVPQIGRTFRDDEAGRYGAPVAIISHRLWQDRFGGDPSIVGRSFTAFTSDRPDHAESFTVVGVLPRDFWYMNAYTEVLAPIREERALYAGRLRADVPRERAEAALTEMVTERMDQVPPGFRVQVVSMQEAHVASVRPTLVTLQAAVLLVLLIACANAAVLILVRSSRRERELAVRRALGASGMRLARQLLLEGGLMAVVATGLALALTSWALGLGGAAIGSRLGTSVPGGAGAISVDGTVLAGAALLAVAVAAVFGVVPLFTALRSSVAASVGSASRGGSESRGRRRFQNAMVAAEVALSLALLTSAGLMVRSAVHLQSRDLGFDATNVVRGQMGLRAASYPEPEDRVRVFTSLADRIAEVPGVDRVGLASMGLFATRFNARPVEGMRQGEVAGAEAVVWTVDDGYFEAIGANLARGRGFSATDEAGSEPVAVVSEALARSLWGEMDPLGSYVRPVVETMPGMAPDEPGPWLRVVGVVSDVARDVGGSEGGDLYRPMRQIAPSWMTAYVRFASDPGASIPLLQQAVDGVDSEIPLASVARLDQAVATAMRPTRYLAGTLAGFSGFALLLAIVGLYGVISYAARQRRKDVAIRIALGADKESVTTLFVKRGLAVVTLGIAIGTFGGFLLGRSLEQQLHGVRAGDPATHAVITALLAVSAVVAVWIPARRAARSDPMGVLREE